jgi:glycosyltransferase involved in cell wall biosynthesis
VNDSPFLTVAIPSYNGQRTIRHAIDSCLGQSWTDFELIVVDDGSVDDTVDVVNAVADRRVQCVRYPTNAGAVANWNRCIGHAAGRYVWILHQDDWLRPGAMEALSAIATACPAAGAICLGGVVTDPSPGEVNPGRHAFRCYPAGNEALHALITERTFCSSMVVRRAVHDRVGGFDERYRYSSDEELWARIATNFAIAWATTPYVAVRRSGDHLMHRTWEQPDFWEQWRELHARIQSYATDRSWCDPGGTELRRLVDLKLYDTTHNIAWFFIRAGRRRLARHYLALADQMTRHYRPRRHRVLTTLAACPMPVIDFVGSRWSPI